ncbi:MAG: histidine ammonia-lyase [Candidatus Nanopelagicales bacterium]
MTQFADPIEVGTLTPAEVIRVLRSGAVVAAGHDTLQRVAAGRAIVEGLADQDRPVYGISTGFGALATVSIPPGRRADLQRSLVRSHAATSGAAVELEIVRALMLLRANTLASGYTGVRPVVLTTLLQLLNSGLVPVVREFGSLGCSGDLAPLAQVALVLIGEGEVHTPAGIAPAGPALNAAGITPVVLAEKEGLALTNGTEGMLGMLLLACEDLRDLADLADLTAAMSVEALLGTDRVFAADLMALRPHPGQARAAARMAAALAGSQIVASHRANTTHMVQDAYSLRCAPQVAGTLRDALNFAQGIADLELSAIIDNPVVLPAGLVESNGNFHGAPVAMALDFLAIPTADLASMTERRTDRLLDRNRSNGLPPFLAAEVGVDSGYMIAQYTAAGIVATLKRLAAPASVDSIPSSAMQEDHVSMGWAAGLKLRQAVAGLRQVLAIEALCAARALDLRAPLAPAPVTAAVRNRIRTVVPGPGPDRVVGVEISAVVDLISTGGLCGILAG